MLDAISKLTVVIALLTLVSCASLARIGAVGSGAAVGSFGGPGGAAAGAIGGLFLAEESFPSDPPAPETIWGLLSKLIDQAGWIAFVVALLWALTWLAPSPIALFKRIAQRWRKPTG